MKTGCLGYVPPTSDSFETVNYLIKKESSYRYQRPKIPSQLAEDFIPTYKHFVLKIPAYIINRNMFWYYKPAVCKQLMLGSSK